MNYDRKALKLEAKALVRSTRPKVWVVTLVFFLLAMVLPQVVEGIFNPLRTLIPELMEEMANMIRWGREPDEAWALSVVSRMVSGGMMVLFISVLLGLFAMVMSYGYRGYALRVFRRQQTAVGNIFSGFPVAGRVIGTEIMVAIFSFLWILLISVVFALVGGLFAMAMTESAFAMLSFLLSIAASFLSILVTLRYCLAPYFVMSQDMGVFAAITASKTAMRGNYMKKFVLDLSFLGWALLVMLIAVVVCTVGSVIVMLTAGSEWMVTVERASHYVMTDEQAAEFALRAMVELLESIMVPMGIVMAVTWLVTLPLTLWLYAYQTVAEAGFFLTVTGQAQLVEGDAPVPQVPVAPTPVQPQPPVAEPVVEPVVEPEPPAAEPVVEPESPAAEPAVEEPPTAEPVTEEPPAEEPETPAE